MQEKSCRKCGEAKPLDQFHKATGARDGHRGECKDCFRLISQERYRKDPEGAIARVRKWREENPEKYQAWLDRNRAANRPRKAQIDRRSYLERTYGITQEDYEFLAVSHDNKCAICGEPDEKGLHVDHDHATGRIRGLLCGSCNRAMGLFHEDPARFEAAGVYLRRTQFRLGTGDRERRPKRKVVFGRPMTNETDPP